MTVFHQHAEPCHRCGATAWEKIDQSVSRRGEVEDIVACVFCGLFVRVEASTEPPQTDGAGEFRFLFGRFKGMTMAEADAEPSGRRYLEVLRDTNDKLRSRIERYLAGNCT